MCTDGACSCELEPAKMLKDVEKQTVSDCGLRWTELHFHRADGKVQAEARCPRKKVA